MPFPKNCWHHEDERVYLAWRVISSSLLDIHVSRKQLSFLGTCILLQDHTNQVHISSEHLNSFQLIWQLPRSGGMEIDFLGTEYLDFPGMRLNDILFLMFSSTDFSPHNKRSRATSSKRFKFTNKCDSSHECELNFLVCDVIARIFCIGCSSADHGVFATWCRFLAGPTWLSKLDAAFELLHCWPKTCGGYSSSSLLENWFIWIELGWLWTCGLWWHHRFWSCCSCCGRVEHVGRTVRRCGLYTCATTYVTCLCWIRGSGRFTLVASSRPWLASRPQ